MDASEVVAHSRVHRIGAAFVVVWSVGVVLREPLQQVGWIGAALCGLWLWGRGDLRVSPALRRLILVAAAFSAWQAISPAVALLTGASTQWPPGMRYGQAFDPLATLAVPLVGALGLPWRTIAVVLGGGWLLSSAVALYQHFVLWPWSFPRVLQVSVERVHENFATHGPPRYGAGGFHFHRLRFAHAAMALLGPATAAIARAPALHLRLLGAAGVVVLLGGIYMAFARAALGAGLMVVAGGLVLFARGRWRLAGIGVAALVGAGVLSSTGWRRRFATAAGNLLEGERMQAMTSGLRMFREHPVFGVGFGNHRVHATQMAPELNMPLHVTWDSHNLWITTLAETGLVGFALLFAFHVLLLRALVVRFREGAWLAGGAVLSFAAFHILAQVHYLPFHSSVALGFSLIWGLGLCAPKR